MDGNVRASGEVRWRLTISSRMISDRSSRLTKTNSENRRARLVVVCLKGGMPNLTRETAFMPFAVWRCVYVRLIEILVLDIYNNFLLGKNLKSQNGKVG